MDCKMKPETLAIAALLPFCVLIGSGCDHALEPGGDHFYFNSFESPQDLVGWRGIGEMQLRNEVPPGGGRKSVFISGGCVIPHAEIEFRGLDQDSYLLLRCWGKNLALGGSVMLQVADDMSKAIYIGLVDTTWKFHQAADTLFLPAHHKLKLSMSSGGFVASVMLVDQIEVIMVD
jgi:hypothetical protein